MLASPADAQSWWGFAHDERGIRRTERAPTGLDALGRGAALAALVRHDEAAQAVVRSAAGSLARVRLPDEPLMLVDRITALEGEPCSMGSGRVVTEHDVLHNGWYLDGGHIPTCVAVEAGQADLFLSGYLGIDFETKGKAMYRLLDAEVTFLDHTPVAGQVIRYDIHIDHFFRHGNPWFFKFWFDATVDGKPLNVQVGLNLTVVGSKEAAR